MPPQTRDDRRRAVAKLRGKWPLIDPDRRAHNGLRLLQAIAGLYAGRLVSLSYAGVREQHDFACRAGHRFSMVAQSVLDGSWCPRCALDDHRLGLADAQAFAIARGGLCTSRTYRTARHAMRWQCALGHEWKAEYRALLDNKEWCPTCRAQQHADKGASALDQLAQIARRHGGAVC